jgi:hypothetical protein
MSIPTIDTLADKVRGEKSPNDPPLHLWNPEVSGDIDIEIRADGTWWHEGGQIERESLVRLFASILRRESDGEYYLVTPFEKWRIKVALHPLLVTDVEREVSEGKEELTATLNTGRQYTIGESIPLFLEPARESAAAIELPNGLTALFTRAAWYRLAEMAETEGNHLVVKSEGAEFDLSVAPD